MKIINKIYLLLILVLLVSGCVSVPQLDEIRNWKIPENPSLINGELENGLKYSVYNSQKLAKDFVDLRLIIDVGSTNELSSEFGYAHLVEHLVFRNTQAYPNGNLNTRLNEMGITIGHDYNAYTSSNFTFYELRVPNRDPDNLTRALEILSQISSQAIFTQADLEVEKKIVLEEKLYRLSEANSVDKKIRRKIANLVYTDYHFPIGSIESINNATIESLQGFYKKWYKPNKMQLVIVGNFDGEKVNQNIWSNFNETSPLPNNEPVVKPKFSAQLERQSFHVVSDGEDSNQDRVNILYIGEKNKTEKYADHEPLLAKALAIDIFVAKLNLLANKRNLASSFTFDVPRYYPELKITRVIGIVRNGNFLELLRIHNEVTQDLLTHGISQKEFEQFKTRLTDLMGNVLNKFDVLKSKNIADMITENILRNSKPVLISGSYFSVVVEFIKSLSVEQVNLAFRQFNSQLKIYSSEANVGRKGSLPTVTESEETTKITSSQAINLDVASSVENHNSIYEEISRIKANKRNVADLTKNEKLNLNVFELTNGYKVFHKHTDIDKNQFSIQLVSPTGRLHLDNATALIHAYITSQLVNSHKLGAFLGKEYSEKLTTSSKSSLPNSYIGEYNHGLIMQGNNRFADYYFKLIKFLWTKPLNISASWFETMMNSLNTEIADYKQTRSSEFYSKLNGYLKSDHPGTRIPELEYYRNFTLQDYKESLQQSFLTNDFYLIIVGDISEKQVKKLLQNYLSDLPDYTFKSFNQVPLAIKKPIQSASFNVKGSSEKRSYLILNYINESHYPRQARAAILVARQLLKSRMRDTIREKYGLVYSIGVTNRLVVYETPSDLTIFNLTTSTANKQQVIDKINLELNRLVDGDFTLAELSQAKKVIKQDTIEILGSNQGWARTFSSSLLRSGEIGKTEVYLNPDAWLKPVTKEQVRQAFAILFDDAITVTAAYDPK